MVVCFLQPIYAKGAVEAGREDVEAPGDACGPSAPAFFFGNSGYTLAVALGAFDYERARPEVS